MNNEIWYTLPVIHGNALNDALKKVLGTSVAGLSHGAQNGKGNNLRVHFVVEPTPELIAAAGQVINAHDPVFLTVDRLMIAANGTDEALITVYAPAVKAAPVTLLVNGIEVAVELTSGVGEVGITSPDIHQIVVTVQNPENRTTDSLSIRAV